MNPKTHFNPQINSSKVVGRPIARCFQSYKRSQLDHKHARSQHRRDNKTLVQFNWHYRHFNLRPLHGLCCLSFPWEAVGLCVGPYPTTHWRTGVAASIVQALVKISLRFVCRLRTAGNRWRNTHSKQLTHSKHCRVLTIILLDSK